MASGRQNKMNFNKIKNLLLSLIISLVFAPATVFAVQLDYEPPSLLVPQIAQYSVTVLIDTEGESVNTVEGSLAIDPALGAAIIASDSGSVITYWVNRPEWDSEKHVVNFSGAIPGGYSGKGILFSVVLPAFDGMPIANPFRLINAKVFRNDGLGTQSRVTLGSFVFGQASEPNVDMHGQLYLDDRKKDNEAPEEFAPRISQDDRVFDGKWFISFNTVDKQSGVDHYEIQETKTDRIDAGKWKTAESPYLLEDQNLNSYVFVIAIDRQGNERVIKVFPRNPLPWYKNSFEVLAVLAVASVVAVAIIYIKKKYNPLSS